MGEYEYSNAGKEASFQSVGKAAAAPYHDMPRFCRKLTFDASAEHSPSFNLDAVKLVYLDASMETLCSLATFSRHRWSC